MQDEDLAVLEREAQLLLANTDAVAAALGFDATYVRQRVQYLLEAYALARTLGPTGTVVVG